jgi:hypothetical protein
MRRSIAVVVIALISAQCGRPGTSRTDAPPVRAGICEIVSNAARFNNRRVQTDGCVITDGLEHVVLAERKRNCAAGGIVPTESGRLKLESRFSPEAHAMLCGTFIGTFRSSTPIYNNVLEVEETRGLERLAVQEQK